ncbi:MAG TPA: tetratricopeptide repeat protein [Acetobacteraceae bacterium]
MYQRGLWHLTRMDRVQCESARPLFRASIELDPTFGLPYQGLARTYLDDVSHYISLSTDNGIKLVLPLASRAVELDPNDANGLGLLGYVCLINGDLTEALDRSDMALDLNQNAAVALQTKGSSLIFLGRYADGIRVLRQYLRLNPKDPWSFRAYVHMAIAHYALTDYEATVNAGQRAVQASPHANGG